jgi:retinol dehydrogenase-12
MRGLTPVSSRLYAGFSPELKSEHNGGYVLAWGRISKVTEDVARGRKSDTEGGTGAAKKFVEYCDHETKEFI